MMCSINYRTRHNNYRKKDKKPKNDKEIETQKDMIRSQVYKYSMHHTCSSYVCTSHPNQQQLSKIILSCHFRAHQINPCTITNELQVHILKCTYLATIYSLIYISEYIARVIFPLFFFPRKATEIGTNDSPLVNLNTQLINRTRVTYIEKQHGSCMHDG